MQDSVTDENFKLYGFSREYKWEKEEIVIARVDGIIESLRLEKTSKSIKSNCQSNTTMPAKLCTEVPYLHVF